MKMKRAAITAEVCRNASEEPGRLHLILNQPIRGLIVRLLPIRKWLFDVTHCIWTTSVNIVSKQENKEFRVTNGSSESRYAHSASYQGLRIKSRLLCGNLMTPCVLGWTGTFMWPCRRSRCLNMSDYQIMAVTKLWGIGLTHLLSSIPYFNVYLVIWLNK